MEFKKEQAVETEQYFTDFWELVMGFCVCVCVCETETKESVLENITISTCFLYWKVTE